MSKNKKMISLKTLEIVSNGIDKVKNVNNINKTRKGFRLKIFDDYQIVTIQKKTTLKDKKEYYELGLKFGENVVRVACELEIGDEIKNRDSIPDLILEYTYNVVRKKDGTTFSSKSIGVVGIDE